MAEFKSLKEAVAAARVAQLSDAETIAECHSALEQVLDTVAEVQDVDLVACIFIGLDTSGVAHIAGAGEVGDALEGTLDHLRKEWE